MNDTQINQVLDKLIQARLVRFIPNDNQDNGQIELVHEALIYNWPRYKGWLETKELTRYKRLRLAKDAQDWDEQGRPPGLLWQGQMLEEAKSYGNLSEIETDFVRIGEDTLKISKLQEEKLKNQVKSLSKNLQNAKVRERSLRERLKSLESKSIEASLYKQKYKRYLLLTVLLLASTIVTISIVIIQHQNRDSQSLQSLREPFLSQKLK